jgi:hypothetical protein
VVVQLGGRLCVLGVWERRREIRIVGVVVHERRERATSMASTELSSTNGDVVGPECGHDRP